MNKALIFFIILTAISITAGCATITTMAWPDVEKEVVSQDKIVDDKIGYDYKLEIKENGFNVKSVSFCREKAAKYKITKKQHRGIVFIIIETPIWGLGLADWVLSYSVSRGSENSELVGYVPTGIKIECGDGEVVGKINILVQNSISGEVKFTETDDLGNFTLSGLLGAYKGFNLYNLFVKENGKTKYLTSVWW